MTKKTKELQMMMKRREEINLGEEIDLGFGYVNNMCEKCGESLLLLGDHLICIPCMLVWRLKK